MNKHAHTVHDTHIHTGATTSVPMYQTPPRTASLSLAAFTFSKQKNTNLISTHYESHIIVIITDLGDKSRVLQIKKPKDSMWMTRMNHTSMRNQLKLNQQQRNSKGAARFHTSRAETSSPQFEGLRPAVAVVYTGWLECVWCGATLICTQPIIPSCFP